MTKFLLTLTATCLVVAATVAKTNVMPPAKVEETFKSVYKKASAVSWKFTRSEYIAEFKENGKKTAAVYSKTGKFVLSKTELRSSELPATVKTSFMTMFKGKTINESMLMIKADGTKQYLVESKGMKAIYSENGKFLKKEGAGEEEDDEEDDDDDVR